MINPRKKKRPYLDYDLEGYIKGQQTARTDATSNLQATTLRLVAENNTSEKVLLRKVANERRKTLEAYDKDGRDYERQQQAAEILEEIDSRPWWSPTTVLRNAKKIPIFGAAPTATEWVYGLMNKAVGNDAVGDYYMLDADKSATGQAIALAAIPAHTNPYTAAMYDTALLAPWAKELDAQGKFYHPETLTGEEAAMLGLSVLPFGLKYRPLLSYAKAAAEDAALQSSIPWIRDNARGLYLSRAINLAVDLGVLAPIKVNRTVERDGTIRMSLPSHTSEQPRLFVIDPLGNNKYYIHMKTWDGKKVPANLSAAEKNALFESVYNELPEGAEILFPKSSEDYLATRGTVAGLQRLSRDPRFEVGSPGTLLYWDDKTKSVKTYNGTSFIKKPLLSATLYVVVEPSKGKIITMKPSYYSKEIKSPYYKYDDNGNIVFDTGNVMSLIKLGKLEFVDHILSPEYAEAAIRNMEEAKNMGLEYFPVFEKEGFKSLVLDGIYPKFVSKPNESWHAYTQMGGGDLGRPTEITFNYARPTNIAGSTRHEVGHVSTWGKGVSQKEHQYLKYKSSLIFKDNANTGSYDFNNMTGEGATNMRDLGVDMGVTRTTPYPGYEKALQQLKKAEKESNKGGIVKFLKLDKEHMPYIWRALLGLHYGLAPGLVAAGTAYGISNQGNNQLIQVQKKGGKILPPWY